MQTSRGVVELHGRDAKIRDDDVRTVESLGRQNFRQVREVGVEQPNAPAPVAERRLRTRKLHGIAIEADETARRRHRLDEGARMSAIAERRIHDDVTGARTRMLEHFREHDRLVPISRCRGLPGAATAGSCRSSRLRHLTHDGSAPVPIRAAIARTVAIVSASAAVLSLR